METMVKKYQQKFRKVREEMDRWGELQSRLLSQYRNASSIIERLQVIHDNKNYGILSCVNGIEDAVVSKQMESLETILLALNKTLEEFHGIVRSLEKTHRDGRQLVKGGSSQLTVKQLQQRVGVKPSLRDCLDGLMLLQDMHHSEYLLKSSIVSARPTLILKPSPGDLGALQQLLVDQPNTSPKKKFSSSSTSYLPKISAKSPSAEFYEKHSPTFEHKLVSSFYSLYHMNKLIESSACN